VRSVRGSLNVVAALANGSYVGGDGSDMINQAVRLVRWR
jgi:hypothetical protein